MTKISVEYLFNLENGGSRKVIISDVRPDIDDNSLLSLADLMIDKKLQYKGSPFVSMKSCTKISSEITKVTK